jgi:mono/diheme cytochrome c family protein
MRTLLILGTLGVAATRLAAEGTGAALDPGRDLFVTHCAACHGADATAGASGDIRGLSRGTILSALGGVEQMPSFSFLTEPEIAALLASLGTREV